MITTTPLDAALDRLHTFHLEYGPGFSDHGPMVVEALDRVGRADAIEGWLDGYERRLDPLDRRADVAEGEWIDRFDAELEAPAWRPVAAAWVGRLSDATATAAGHGLLRTAHAVRSLSRADTPTRRRELARGLAYWAWRAAPLPRIEPRGERPPVEVLADLDRLGADHGEGRISTRVAGVAGSAFIDAASSVRLAADPAAALGEVTAGAAAALASGPISGTFALLHGLTASVAARDLLALSGREDATHLVTGAWTTVAALWSAYGGSEQLQCPTVSPAPMARDELVDRAIAHGDEHAIKVAVAVWSEEQATGGDRPDLRAAARRGMALFGA